MGVGASQRNDNRFKPKNVGEKLSFDGVEIEKNVIKERINSELNTLLETRMDQLRDGVPNIINRF